METQLRNLVALQGVYGLCWCHSEFSIRYEHLSLVDKERMMRRLSCEAMEFWGQDEQQQFLESYSCRDEEGVAA